MRPCCPWNMHSRAMGPPDGHQRRERAVLVRMAMALPMVARGHLGVPRQLGCMVRVPAVSAGAGH